MDEDRQIVHSFVRIAYDWCRAFIPDQEWQARKNKIQEHLLGLRRPRTRPFVAEDFASVSVSDDRFGWYLYLAETFLETTQSYEPIQGARVIPIFTQLGRHPIELSRIQGVRERFKEIVNHERMNADQGLFEILTALMYARNGWSTVEFIPKDRRKKTPDIRVADSSREFFIECKRLAGRSGYSLEERKKWLRLWQPLVKYLVERKLPLVIDFTFHVELSTLSDNFLLSEIAPKLELLPFQKASIPGPKVSVTVDVVKLSEIAKHLEHNFVRDPSDLLNELILGKRDVNSGTSCFYVGKGGTMGEATGTNRFIESIEFAGGALWHCDSPKAISAKARDVRRHLAEAVEQLPPHAPSIVHIGVETIDGWPVEQERYAKICATISGFDSTGIDLQWIYCHLFQAYSPPEKDWEFDETVYYFSKDGVDPNPPLKEHSMVIPYDTVRDGVHWKPTNSVDCELPGAI